MDQKLKSLLSENASKLIVFIAVGLISVLILENFILGIIIQTLLFMIWVLWKDMFFFMTYVEQIAFAHNVSTLRAERIIKQTELLNCLKFKGFKDLFEFFNYDAMRGEVSPQDENILRMINENSDAKQIEILVNDFLEQKKSNLVDDSGISFEVLSEKVGFEHKDV